MVSGCDWLVAGGTGGRLSGGWLDEADDGDGGAEMSVCEAGRSAVKFSPELCRVVVWGWGRRER